MPRIPISDSKVGIFCKLMSSHKDPMISHRDPSLDFLHLDHSQPNHCRRLIISESEEIPTPTIFFSKSDLSNTQYSRRFSPHKGYMQLDLMRHPRSSPFWFFIFLRLFCRCYKVRILQKRVRSFVREASAIIHQTIEKQVITKRNRKHQEITIVSRGFVKSISFVREKNLACNFFHMLLN
jgi:hypothetical protein